MNNKSVLVIDTPELCCECKFAQLSDIFSTKEWFCVLQSDTDHDNITCAINSSEAEHQKQKWCPLKDLPKIIPYKKGEPTRIKWHDIGYNNCIRELLGESWKMEGETDEQ